MHELQEHAALDVSLKVGQAGHRLPQAGPAVDEPAGRGGEGEGEVQSVHGGACCGLTLGWLCSGMGLLEVRAVQWLACQCDGRG